MLIVAHRAAFDRVYGSGAWQAFSAPLAAYISRIASSGIRPSLLYLDNPAESGFPGIAGSAMPGGDTAAAAVRAALRTITPRPDAVLLIGGDEALPMVRMASVETVHADDDPSIPTDNPYGCVDDDEERFIDPVVPIGRFAAGASDGTTLLIDQLERAIAARTSPTASSGSFVVSNMEWLEASREVSRAIGDSPQIFASSPHYAFSSGADWDRAALFFNLHGQRDRSDWFGRTGPLTWPVVNAPKMAGVSLHAVAFACNCYGADIAGRSAQDSMALALVKAGAASVIASTGFAFGADSPDADADFSEELARRFFSARSQGVAAGRALWQARRDYVHGRVTDGTLDNRDYKTALQFVYIGDPLL